MGMVAANRVFKILDTESKILNSGNLSYDSFFGNIKFNNITLIFPKNEIGRAHV